MGVLILGGLLVTMDDKRTIIKDGGIAIEGNKIIDVGKRDSIKKRYPSDIVIEADKKIVMPGFICTHTHMSSVLGHNMPVDFSKFGSLDKMLEKWWWPMIEDQTKRDDVYYASLFACLKMIKSGTTCIADMVEAPKSIDGCLDYGAKALEKMGMRGILSFEATERINQENGEDGIKENLRFIQSINDNKESRIKGRFGIHSTYTCSPEVLKRIRSLADEYNEGILIHVSETTYELDIVKKKYGKTPVELLDDIGFLRPDVLAIHCVHLTDSDIDKLRSNDVKVSHTPMSNTLVATGVARIPYMLEKGMTVGIGHDCHFTMDMTEYMRAVFNLHKIHNLNASLMPPNVEFEMATIHGAKALQMENEIGSIEPQKKADIIIVDPKSPTPVYDKTFASYVIWDMNGCDVHTVIIDGEIIMEKGKLKGIDEQEIIEKCQERAFLLWKRDRLV
jgi:cytosine/adenosine deaminase-related metal-dependent hydrolase